MKLGFLTDGRTEDASFAADAGFDCLELALFGDTPLFENHRDFQSSLQDNGIPLAAVSLFGLNYFDPEKGAFAVETLRRVFDLTAALDCPLVVFGTGTPPGNSHREKALNALDKVAPLVTEAQSKGLAVALYNCHWENWIDRPDAWHVVLPRLPGVGIKFDPSHPVQGHRDWKEELLATGSHLRHTHAKDVLEVNGRYIPDPNPGMGDIRWEVFFGILYHLGYTGAVCIEPHSPVYTGDRRHDFLRLSGSYLRQFIVRSHG